MTTAIVLTVDQRGSRHSADRIPATLSRLAPLPTLLPFERTAGDEFQGVLDDPDAVAAAVGELLRDDGWYVGIGVGAVEEPLPDHARAGRGPAYLQARTAVSEAKTSPWHVRVLADHASAPWAGRALETTLWLWAAVLGRRTTRGWEVADLVAQGMSYADAGHRLGISQSAVSQRAQAAGIVEARRAEELAAVLARTLLEET
ncbi:transposase [Nocardioides sp.]|uniref:transposase n=1 Tax=Nocardioides sp. TaxID=35761 RepID=UPI002EDABA23